MWSSVGCWWLVGLNLFQELIQHGEDHYDPRDGGEDGDARVERRRVGQGFVVDTKHGFELVDGVGYGGEEHSYVVVSGIVCLMRSASLCSSAAVKRGYSQLNLLMT